MSWKLSERFQVSAARYLLYAALAIGSICLVSIAEAVELGDAMSISERADRMGTVGILILCLLGCFAIVGYLIRVICREGLKLIVENQRLLTQNQVMMSDNQKIMIEVKDAIISCKHSH
jgi:hypothetical protein